ncbi:MAG: flagellar export protein FliJ [Leptothrix sp. (in: Bacteria)]|nr:flagellar export protein FliJ [Leptothrix sp. (in: b-proteobacteria)]
MTTALNTLLEHAERQRDETLIALLQTEALLRSLAMQAEQLLAYRDEYRQRNPALGGRSAGIEALRCHQDFVQRLDQAMQQQAGQVQGAEARCAVLRGELMAQELRVASVRKLMDRRGQQARVHADRMEQRRSDDAAQNQYRRQTDAAQGGGWRLGAEAAPAAH